MDVDRYVTYPVVRDAWLSLEDTASLQDAEMILRTALPGILAEHRADVLREVALVLGEKHTLVPDERERRGYAAAARQVRRLCDAAEGAEEAVVVAE